MSKRQAIVAAMKGASEVPEGSDAEFLVDDSFCGLAELAALYGIEHWLFTRSMHTGELPYWQWVQREIEAVLVEAGWEVAK